MIFINWCESCNGTGKSVLRGSLGCRACGGSGEIKNKNNKKGGNIMKKLFVGSVIGLSIFVGSAFGVNANSVDTVDNNFSEYASYRSQVTKVKNLHGFMVLDQAEKENGSTIAVRVESADNDYFYATNIFDITDNLVIDKVGTFKIGDILLVTFSHDDVEKVVKNTKNIENIVIGQKVVK